MIIKQMAIMTLLGIGCLGLHNPAIAQPGPRSSGPQGAAPGASMRSYGAPGAMPPSNYRPGGTMGGPAGYQSAPGMRSPSTSPNIPSTRFGSVPDGRRSYGGPTSQPPGQSYSAPQAPRGYAPPDASRMQQALRKKDYEAIGIENQGIRNRADNLPQMGPELSVQDRLKLPLLQHKYRQGAEMIDEGRNTRNESKIRYGLQQIQDADQRFERMDEPGQRHRR